MVSEVLPATHGLIVVAYGLQLYNGFKGPACLAVKPLDLHLVNVGSILTGPTHGEVCLQPHPGDVLTSTPKVRKSPRSGLNLEGRLSDPQNYNGFELSFLCLHSIQENFQYIWFHYHRNQLYTCI